MDLFTQRIKIVASHLRAFEGFSTLLISFNSKLSRWIFDDHAQIVTLNKVGKRQFRSFVH